MNIKILLFASSVLFIFTACSPKDVEVYQQEDVLLNCNQLTTKIADLIDTNHEINDVTGIEAKSAVIWIFSTPLGIYNQIDAYDAREHIDKRFYNLINLKKQHNCNISYRELAFAKYKGRASETLQDYYIQLKQYSNSGEY